MQPTLSSGNKVLIAIGGVLLLFLIIVGVILTNKQGISNIANTPTTAPLNQIDHQGLLTYHPPTDSKFTGLEDINFLPAKINATSVDQEKVLTQAEKLYPSLSQDELLATINQSLISWLAMNDYYKNNEPAKVSPRYQENMSIDDFTSLDNDYHQQLQDYNTKEIKISGFYIKARFAHVRPENISKIGKSEAELRSFAQQKVNQYVTDAQSLTNKSTIVDKVNADNTMILLNNGDQSQIFTNRSLYPPLVSDPDYYNWVQRLLVGQFSDVLSLQEYDVEKNAPQDYAYAAFYLSKKDGNHLPIHILANQFIAKSNIQ